MNSPDQGTRWAWPGSARTWSKNAAHEVIARTSIDPRQGRGLETGNAPQGVAGRSRTVVLDSQSVGLVEDLRRDGDGRCDDRPTFCPVFQVCLPYRGVFIWHVGREEIVGDANQVVFVQAREESRVSDPLGKGYGELIITPTLEVLSELANASGVPPTRHALFARRIRRANADLQLLRTRFLYGANEGSDPTLAMEEALLAILRRALCSDEKRQRRPRPRPTTARLIRRAKEFLEAEYARPIRLSDIGRAVGASPMYLTDVFRKTEGTPLHRYLNQLRLAHALVALPHAEDLTSLALDVGFSSHSHFSAAFRRAFGATPSEWRATIRRESPPVRPARP